MTGHPPLGIASDFVLIVVAGFAGGLIARILRLPLLVGYVAAGVFVGPYTAAPTVAQVRDIELLAEIGVALLLFSLGLEISFRDLKPVRRFALGGGPLQIALTMGAAAWAGSSLLGIPVVEAVWLGAMAALSSTTVVLKTLTAAGVTSTLASRAMIGLLAVQDLAVIPMLIILPQLGDLDRAVGRVAQASAVAVLFLAAMVVIGTRLLPRLLEQVLKWGSRELFLIAVVTAGVGVGFAAHSVGLSLALGAFVAGIVLSESSLSHQALSDIVPLRDVFGLIFFVSVGMLLDPRFVWEHGGTIALAVMLIFLCKSLIAGGLAGVFGYRNDAPFIIGLGLSQIGEFSFVLARGGLSGGFLSKSTYDLVLGCTVFTMALSPLVSSMALPLSRRWRSWRKPALPASTFPLPEESMRDHVIVAGYGRTGRAVVGVLRAAGIPLVAVELNHAALAGLVSEGQPAVWGDITREEILRAAGAPHARMLVLAVPDHNTVRLAIQSARRLNSRLFVIARAARTDHVEELRKLDRAAAVQPEFEGGIEIVRRALEHYDYDGAETARLIRVLRDELYRDAA